MNQVFHSGLGIVILNLSQSRQNTWGFIKEGTLRKDEGESLE